MKKGYSDYKDFIETLNDLILEWHPLKKSDSELRAEFISRYISGFDKFSKELEFDDIYKDDYEGFIGGIDSDSLEIVYSLIRERKPEIIVETGVCDGYSTGVILAALEKNGKGELYSIDYPFYADDSLEEFRNKTFENYGGAAIPSDKEPGWIVQEHLKEKWNYIEGKSQEELPNLISDLENIDLFIHDSEHSAPCMMFELEIAYHNLAQEGIIILDDIKWNRAFNIFTKVRKSSDFGRFDREIGYVIK